MNDNKPIYKGGWQFGDIIREELKGPIGEGEVTYPNGDHFKGYFHLSYASINGPAYAADGRYDFADGSFIEKAWINTSSDRTMFDLHGVFRIQHPEGHESIAMFFRNKRIGFELVLTEKPFAIEWYSGVRQREWEIESHDINQPDENCLTLTLTLKDGTRIEQRGGRYTSNKYNKQIYEPHTDITVYSPNGDSLDMWNWGLKSLKPYDGYFTVHCAETQRFREEHWENGNLTEAEDWKRDFRAAECLTLPDPFGKGESRALVWQDGHITYDSGDWVYDGEVKDNRPEGLGVLTGGAFYNKGQRYEGEFHEGLVHGQGVFEDTKTGIRLEGTFVNGVYQEPNATTEPITLHAHHGHSSWSISSRGEWKYKDSDFEAKLDRLPFSGFGDIRIARIEKDCITLADYDGNVKTLHPGETVHYTAEIEGREWSDGCVYDGDDYSLALTWEDIKIDYLQSPLETTFEITHDREFLQHFLTRWRTLSISPEMVERLKNSDDYYACYGYGQWLYYANPDGNSIKEAQEKLTLAANYGYVADAFAALAQMYYDGTVDTEKTDHEMHAFLMYKAQTEGSELAQYLTLFNTIFGDYGFKKDPAETIDILEKHLEKHPDSDPIYWDLLGLAHEMLEHDEAVECYKKSIEMGNTESYFSLAKYYYDKGFKTLSRKFAEEGMAKGAVNCHRALASFMTLEEFEALPEEKQKEVHEEMDCGLRYAVEHYDRRACYIMAIYVYYGQMGYEADIAEALLIAKRGCELGYGLCFELLALVQDIDENIPDELRISQSEIVKLYLQALRMDIISIEALEKVARAYTANLLPMYDEEIEKSWLPKYYDQSMANDESLESMGVLVIYPQGFFNATEVESETFDTLSDLAQLIDADGIDIVHYSEPLNRMTKVLCRGKYKDCHIAMVVDRDGYAKDLPDNMPGTLLYGHGMEIRGAVILVLEDEKYHLKPIKGLAFFNMCINMLNAATAGLTRYPTDEEIKAIESADDDLVDGDEEIVENGHNEVSLTDEDEDAEQKTLTVKLADIDAALEKCNLCRDTLFVVCPVEYGSTSTNDLMYPIKDAVELNIKCNGGYMIDEWQFVDSRQEPMDIRSRVRFKLEDDDEV